MKLNDNFADIVIIRVSLCVSICTFVPDMCHHFPLMSCYVVALNLIWWHDDEHIYFKVLYPFEIFSGGILRRSPRINLSILDDTINNSVILLISEPNHRVCWCREEEWIMMMLVSWFVSLCAQVRETDKKREREKESGMAVCVCVWTRERETLGSIIGLYN
jgi:hypothetical protein